MSIDLDDLLAERPTRKTRMDDILANEIDDANRPKLIKHLSDKTVSRERIVVALAKLDPPIRCSEHAIKTWRKDNGIA